MILCPVKGHGWATLKFEEDRRKACGANSPLSEKQPSYYAKAHLKLCPQTPPGWLLLEAIGVMLLTSWCRQTRLSMWMSMWRHLLHSTSTCLKVMHSSRAISHNIHAKILILTSFYLCIKFGSYYDNYYRLKLLW